MKNRWKKGSFDYTRNYTTEKTTVKGYIFGNIFGIDKRSQAGYFLTHLPTGRRIYTHDKLGMTKRIAEYLDANFPGRWNKTEGFTPEFGHEVKKAIADLLQQYQRKVGTCEEDKNA